MSLLAAASPARRLGRLLRVSMAPSAAADVIVGMAIGGGGLLPGAGSILAAVLASLCVYHGALALNDWADIEHDRLTRPERPLPSGEFSPDLAFGLGQALVLFGVVLGAIARASAWPWILGLACCAVAYDLVGRGPLRGPLLLAACRAGNLLFGVAVALPSIDLGLAQLGPAVIYGAYVLLLSLGGRLEDGESQADVARAGPLALGGAAAVLALAGTSAWVMPGSPVAGGPWIALLLALGAAATLLRSAVAIQAREDVAPVMGMALRRLLVLVAVLALGCGGPGHGGGLAAFIALLGYPFSFWLRRWFPPS